MFRHILLPTDGSELANRAVEKGIELAKALGAKATLLFIVERFHVMTLNPTALREALDTYERQTAELADKLLGEAAGKAAAAGVPVTRLTRVGDSPADEICKVAAESGADLIAMGSHGRRGFSALMLGSQTSRVLTGAKVPVLVFR
jgi:nucleotide-binding universal stress UspA family protein